MRRVVVTGLGLLTPLACGVERSWQKLINGQSGISQIKHFDVSDIAAKIGGVLPYGDGTDGTFCGDDWMEAKEQRKVDPFILFAVAAAGQAIADSGWQPSTAEEKERTGVMVGSGIGGLSGIAETAVTLHEQGPRRVSPFFIPGRLINLAAGHVAIRHDFRGPNHAVVTACASGTHAIGDAARFIAYDDADVMVAGGSEAALCRIGMAGFASARALCTGFNDRPQQASRPWDKMREGFVMGEGAGMLVLEEYEHAKARGAKIYAEIIGYGLSGDAYHITAPSPSGDGAYRSMKAALKRAEITPQQVDYINAHGTSTVADAIEFGAVKRLFGSSSSNVAMSSTKSSIGHLLGAAGAVEAIFCILAIRDGIMPPTLNLDDPDEGCTDINLIPHVAQKREINIALSNSFGFGGTNASVVIRKI